MAAAARDACDARVMVDQGETVRPQLNLREVAAEERFERGHQHVRVLDAEKQAIRVPLRAFSRHRRARALSLPHAAKRGPAGVILDPITEEDDDGQEVD